MIELTDTLGGEDKVIERAKRHKRSVVRSTAVGLLTALAAIAAGVYEIIAAGPIAALVWRIVFGALGVVALGAASAFASVAIRENKKLTELARRLKERDLHVALDTSGCVLNEGVMRLLDAVDMVLLDVKFDDESTYFRHTGGSFYDTVAFLD